MSSAPLVRGLPPTVAAVVKRRLRDARRLLGDRPVFLPLIFAANPLGSSRAISPTTDVVVEGFPRSGNTFIRFALLQANGPGLEISSHVHVPAQVELAVRHALPTLVVVRDPIDTVASNLVYSPHARPEQVLAEWIHYHRRVLPLHDGLVLATFDEVVTDLGAVTARVNARFGTDLLPFVPSEPNRAEVFAAIEAHHLHVHDSDERTVPRPSAVRRPELDQIAAELGQPAHAEAVARARALYDRAVDLTSA